MQHLLLQPLGLVINEPVHGLKVITRLVILVGRKVFTLGVPETPLKLRNLLKRLLRRPPEAIQRLSCFRCRCVCH